METLQRSPDINQTGGDLENKEKLNELEAIPIFRNNDLYTELFPEIKPTFEKGEEPTLKKIVSEIIKYQNKKIIFDNTSRNIFMYGKIKPEDFSENKEWYEIVSGSEGHSISTGTFEELIKEKLGIEISSTFIESEMNETFKNDFSPKLVDELFEIAKGKNSNIKQVYILSEAITDHVYEFRSNFPKDKVVPTLVEEARKTFGIEPVVLATINESEIKEGDLIVVDRHNSSVRGDIVSRKPTQFSVLPMETELSNNDRYLTGNHTKLSGELSKKLRKIFEKKLENEND